MLIPMQPEMETTTIIALSLKFAGLIKTLVDFNSQSVSQLVSQPVSQSVGQSVSQLSVCLLSVFL